MKRAALTIFATITGLVLLLGFKTQPVGTLTASGLTPSGSGNGGATTSGQSNNGSSNNGSNSGSSSSGSSGGSPSSSATTQAPAPTSQSVTGQAAQTAYGPVQIKLTASGGRITDVKILQAPWGTGTDQQISSYSLPILIRETISAQSAGIDMVSGATYTSDGYIRSLQSALDQLNA